MFLEEAASLPASTEISAVVATTVLLSVLLHGLTAAPLSSAYARRADGPAREAPEKREGHGSEDKAR